MCRKWLINVVPVLAFGCAKPAESIAPDGPVAAVGQRFDPAAAGTIAGRVAWAGEVPNVPPFHAATSARLAGVTVANPHAPRIDPADHGLAGVVVSLERVDPARSRPWDLPPVRVVVRGHQMVVDQGEPGRRVGFVRAGDAVEMTSEVAGIQMVRARGAAYFTLPFPEVGRPLTRRLDTPGRVELTNGAGYYWQSADLFVCDHPYHTTTDAHGRYTLPQVPAGEYSLAFWTRSWQIADVDTNPETGLILRQRYRDPVGQTRLIGVTAGRETTAPDVAFGPADFR